MSAILSGLLWWLHRWRPAWSFSASSVRKLAGFGGYHLGSSVLEVMYARLYTILVGRLFGALELGLYNNAEGTRQLPAGFFGSLLARVALIRSARRSIDLQTYIFDEDDSAHLVLDELQAAAFRGVKVRVLLDQLSALEKVSTMAAFAAAEGFRDVVRAEGARPAIPGYDQDAWVRQLEPEIGRDAAMRIYYRAPNRAGGVSSSPSRITSTPPFAPAASAPCDT